jgi:ribosomal protein S18 acetylase RimI-like enzyme
MTKETLGATCVQLRRDVTPQDRQLVRDVVASTGVFRSAEIEVAVELVDEYLSKGRGSGYQFIFAADATGTVGYICYGPIAVTQSSYDLYWIAVHSMHQGQGIARILLEEMEIDICRAGGRRVYVETSGRPTYEPARKFYERCGYQHAAVLPEFYGPHDDKVVYVKVLKH